MATTAKYFVPRMLGPFYKRYPGVDLAVEIVNRDRVIERLVNNMDDLYIMGVPPEHIAIEKHLFLENPLVVIAPREHELAQRKRILLPRLARERLIAREAGSGTRITTEAFLRKHRIKWPIQLELGNNEAIKWAVAGGLGVSVVSRHCLMLEPMHDKLAVLDVEEFPIHGAWFVVYPQGKQLSVVARTFFDYLKSEAVKIQDELALPRQAAAA